jgi:hypothetical protein
MTAGLKSLTVKKQNNKIKRSCFSEQVTLIMILKLAPFPAWRSVRSNLVRRSRTRGEIRRGLEADRWS